METRFEGHYVGWREKRINKILQIFGKEFFNGKTILEIACGYGHIGMFFTNLGAIVEFTEGREEHISFIEKNNPGCKIHLVNHDEPWNLNKKYDLIIHLGLLYHLENWQQDLFCTFQHSNLIVLESQILDSLKGINEYLGKDGGGYDQALPISNFAIRPNSMFVEKIISDNNFNFIRYDDADLNTDTHNYSWKEKGKHDELGHYCDFGLGALRRFWILKKNV